MEDISPQSQGKDHAPAGYKIPAVRTYENDIAEATAAKKISSASIIIAEADRRRKETASIPSQEQMGPAETLNVSPLQESIAAAPPIETSPREEPINQTARPTFIPATPIIPITTVKPTISEIPRVETRREPEVIPENVVTNLKVTTRRTNNGHAIKTILEVLVSVILIGGGITVTYFLYIQNANKNTGQAVQTQQSTNIQPSLPSIVTPDSQKIIDVTNLQVADILDVIKKPLTGTSAQSGTIHELVFQSKSGTSTTVSTITPVQFLYQMKTNPPASFTTSLGDTWMFGIDSTGGTTSAPFILLTTNFFQNTFAGMLSWEPTIPEDLSQLLNFPIGVHGTYQDRILDNKNIREYISITGVPIFLYGFIDNQKLLITRDEGTFRDIVDRIEKQSYIR